MLSVANKPFMLNVIILIVIILIVVAPIGVLILRTVFFYLLPLWRCPVL
jgi:hypothetical protein